MQLASPRKSLPHNDIMRMNQTVTEGMTNSLQVVGAPKTGWENPDSTAKNAMGHRDPNLSITDIVNNVLKKPAFGFEGYNPKAVVKDLLPVNTHVRARAKRIMFCEAASKIADKVPAADKYQSAIDWNKNPTTRTIKFYTDKRTMVADEIIKKSQKPEKCSPGPAAHNHYEGWKGTLKKVPGMYKNREARITFTTEATYFAALTPGHKYPSVNLVRSPNLLFLELTTQ